jgi:hypothetical protein
VRPLLLTGANREAVSRNLEQTQILFLPRKALSYEKPFFHDGLDFGLANLDLIRMKEGRPPPI